MRLLTTLTIIALGSFLAGCGGGGSGATIRSLTVSPTNFEARVGDVVPLTASAEYSNGSIRYVTDQVAWDSSSPGIATVGTLSWLTAHDAGQTQITASKGSVTSDPLTVTVLPVPDLPTAGYFPLGTDYQWEYTGTEVSGRGVTAQAVSVTLVVTATQQIVRGGRVWHDLVVKGSDPLDTPGQLLLRHDAAGLVRYDPYGTEPVRVLDASLQAGTQWADPEDPRRTFLIESTTAHVDVPAGSYDGCVKVVETDLAYDPANIIKAWYKAGVGLVWQQQFEGDQLQAEQKLYQYHLGLN